MRVINKSWKGATAPAHVLAPFRYIGTAGRIVLNCGELLAWASPPGEEGWGTRPPIRNSVGVPRKSWFLKKIFRIFGKIFRSFNIYKIKWAKSEEKSAFGVGGFDSPESVPPVGIHLPPV